MSPLLGSTGLVSYYSYRGNIDTLPDVFSIGADVTDVEIDAEITRTTTITGINYKAKVTPSSGATISVNGSGYTSTAQYVKNNQSISIKFTPTDYETTYTVSLTVGKRSDAYTILTRNRPEDGIPNAFSFTDQTDVDPPFRTNVESNVITLSGMSNVPSGQTPRTNDIGTASISGNSAQFKVIRDGAVVRVYGTGNFSVINGDQIQLRMNAGGNAQTVSTTFSVTGTDTTNLASPVTSTVSDTWSITSRTYTATITLSASPGTVDYNTASTISWTSQNISGPINITNIGNVNDASGSRSTGNLNGGASGGTRTFTATANTLYSPPATVTSNTVTVNINPPPAPSVSLSSGSNSIAYNSSTTLSWSSSNATSVNSSTDNFAGSNLSGSNVSTGNLTQSKTYTIVVGGLEGQTATSSVTINVEAPPEIVKYITANTTNADAQSYFGSTDWTRSVNKRLVINGGVVVGSTNPSAAALSITAGVVGAFVLENNGSIQGAGGLGGVANGGNGGKGGNAIIINNKGTGGTVSITNNGSIYAGGGGGGAGTKGGRGGDGGPTDTTELLGFERYNSNKLGLHFYTSYAAGEFLAINEYYVENTNYFWVTRETDSSIFGTVPLYRFFNGSTGDHLFGLNANEVPNQGGAGWNHEGIIGYVWPPNNPGPNTNPVYRKFNGLDHLLTTDRNEASDTYALDVDPLFYTVTDSAYYIYPTKRGTTGAAGGNGGNGGVGQGYAQNAASGAAGAAGATNANTGITGGDGGTGGSGGSGGGFGADGSNGSQGNIGGTGTNGGSGGLAGELPVGIRGLAGYYINGIDNLNGGVGGTVGGRTKNIGDPATTN